MKKDLCSFFLFLTGYLIPIESVGNDAAKAVVGTPGLVAFWDFVKREPEGAKRFTAHVPEG